MDYRTMIGRHRAALMGLASLMIIYYHAAFARGRLPLGRLSQAGVDLFVFAAGYGLAFALAREDGAGEYLRRRLKRLLPAYYVWLIAMIVAMLAVRLLLRRSMHGVDFLLLHLFPWGVWINRLPKVWYVSAALGYYAMAPLFYGLTARARRPRLAAAALTAVTAFLLPSISRMNHVTIATMRIPALAVGIAVGSAAQQEDARPNSGLACLALAAAAGIGQYLWRGFPLLAHVDMHARFRLMLNLCGPFACALLACAMELLARSPLRGAVRGLAALGRYSLEIYLVHVPVDAVVRDCFRLPAIPVLLILLIASYPLARATAWAAGRLERLWQSAWHRAFPSEA